jgi:hypothetical protein
MKTMLRPAFWLFLAAFVVAPLAALAQTPDKIEVVSPDPSQTIAGQPVQTNQTGGRPTVKVTDAGAPVAGVTVSVDLNQESFLDGSTTTVTTNEEGLAVFDNLKIGKAQAGYILEFTVVGSDPSVTVVSFPFPIVAAQPSQVEMVVEPADTEWTNPLSGPPTVLVKDSFGNPANAGINVTAALSDNTFTLDSETSVLTGSDGRAVFGNLIPANVGNDYTITFTLQTSGNPAVTSDTFDVIPKTLIIGGTFTAEDKVYNGNDTAPVLDTGGLTLIGVRSGDDVSLANIQARFAQATVGTGITVNLSSASLTGAGAGNYVLSLADAPATTAAIIQKTLTIGGSFTALNKTYDGDVTAAFNNNSLSLVGVVNGDAVFMTNTVIAFASPLVNTGIKVSIVSTQLVGAQAANYEVNVNAVGTPSTTADINRKKLTVGGSFTANNKVYDKSRVATFATNDLSLIGVVPADSANVALDPYISFASTAVGTGISVKLNRFTTKLTGSASANYEIDYTGEPTATADITRKPLKLGGSIDAASKTYDGTTVAILTANNLTLIGVINGDTVTLDKAQTTADFEQKDVGTNIEVGVTSVAITGVSAPNYEIDYTGSPVTMAGISPKELTIGGSFTTADKTYDGTTDGEIEVNDLELVGVVVIDDRPDDVALDAVATFAQAEVGVNITVDLLKSTLAGTSAGNYTLSYMGAPTSAADITTAALTIDVDNATRTAEPGLPDPLPLYTITGLVPGDTDEEITGDPVVFTSVNLNTTTAGSYPGDLGVETNGSKADNYTITTNKGTLTITPAAPSQLVNVSQPIQTEAGANIQGDALEFPAVALEDAYGNRIAGQAVSVSLSDPSVTLFGTTAVTTDGDGVASFADLQIGKAGGGYVLNYTFVESPGIQFASAQFNIIAAAASKAAIVQEPTDAVAGAIIVPSPRVLLTDPYDNPALGPYEVAASLTAGTPLFGATTRENNTTTGLVVFDDLSVQRAGTYVMRFTPLASGIDIVDSTDFTISPDLASAAISVSEQPSETVAGEAINPSPQVLIQDRFDNPVPDYAVTPELSAGSFAGGGGAVSTGPDGFATFSAMTINVAGTDYTIEFSFVEPAAEGTAKVSSDPFDVIHAALNKFVFDDVNAEQTAGESFDLTITAQDEFGNTVTSFTGTAGLSLNKNETAFAAGGGTTPPFIAGVLANHPVVITKADTDYIITATETDGSVTGSSNEFAVKPAPANYFTLSGPASVVAGVTSGNFAVTVYDEFENVAPVSGLTTFNLTASQEAATATFDPDPLTLADGSTGGTFTYRNTKVGTGTHAITAAYASGDGGLAGQLETVDITVTPAAASKLEIVTQPSDTAQAGAPFAQQPAVQVTDEFGNPLAEGFTVTASIATGGPALIGTASASTSSSGVATFTDLGIGGLLGQRTLQFSAPGLLSVVSDPVDVDTPGVPFALVTVQGPSNIIAGQSISPAPSVRLQDAYTNVIAGQAVQVSLEPVGKNFAVGTVTTATTGSDGVAVFPGLKIEEAFKTYRLKFTHGLVTRTTGQFAVNAAAPATLEVATAPSAVGTAGAALDPKPVVTVKDTFGNAVTGARIEATLNGGSLAPGTTVSLFSNDEGQAVFDNLVINTAGTGYTITFRSLTVGNPSVTTEPFAIEPDAANAQIGITQEPEDSVAGETLAGPPTIKVADPYGNAVADKTVEVSLLDGSFAAGTTTKTTGVGGVVTFDDLVVEQADTYRLRFVGQSGFAATKNSAEFTVAPAAAAKLVLSTEPEAGAAGALLVQQPVLHILDAYNNLVTPDSSTMVSVAIHSGASGVLGGTTSQEAAGGIVTFDDLTLGGLVGEDYVLRFTAEAPATIGFVDSDSLKVTSGTPSAISVTNQPVTSFAGQAISGLDGGSVAVKVTDAFTNPVEGVSVTPQAIGFVFAQTGSVFTGANGVAEFPALVINTAGNGYSIAFRVGGTAPQTTSAQFNILTANATSLTITQQPTDTVVGDPITPAPAVKLTDSYGNPASGFDVMVVLQGNTTAARTGVNGISTFTGLIPLIEAAGVKLTFNADVDGVPDIESSPFNVLAPGDPAEDPDPGSPGSEEEGTEESVDSAPVAPRIVDQGFKIESDGSVNDQVYVITFEATPGYVYAIEASADAGGFYEEIGRVIPEETLTTIELFKPGNEPIYFWRIRFVGPVDP